ncbi:Putative white-brown complex homolog protein 30 [Seminavis robusta]|uniref:White-brown complex homolog protein 30 n=1 Tax=Seminavis robusta TaxID=568900 RepID=A0A9N8HC22_9STRA|nr:Putative white-brown complex homolog protein 30 [Seminavis robusta]|eukprot:Sro204_g085770.1 Putative white-brown complex homolog protein 30 (752) ;mRNA; f:11208-13636
MTLSSSKNGRLLLTTTRFLLVSSWILGGSLFAWGNAALFKDASTSTGSNGSIPFVRHGGQSDLNDVSSTAGIFWENLSCSTANEVSILNPSSGFVANGQVCGILGPSGSGKSTFLSIMAGRQEASLSVGGFVQHHRQSEFKDPRSASHFSCGPVLPDTVAWLQQQDAFFEQLTVQETLDLAVFLEWPLLPKSQRDGMAQACLEALGLTKVRSRRVGNPTKARASNGATLSGGELRRLSVALELVTQPQLFVCDEPTTGIDSKMSETVMAAIASLAKKQNIPCFCTLHQPRSSIWHMLDVLILMAPGGRVCYVGSCHDSVPYFASLGYNCPNETNPAEYFIDLVSVDTEDPLQAIIDRDRIDRLASAFERYNRPLPKQLKALRLSLPTESRRSSPSTGGRRSPVTTIRRFGALLRRSWRQTYRSVSLNLGRLAISSGTAILLSQIFPSVAAAKGLPPTNNSVTDRICVLTFGVINMFLVSVVKTIDIFSKEKPIVQRERNRNDYTNLEYILSKALSEFPLDAAFTVVFTTTLKLVTGLAIEWKPLSMIFSLMTCSGASLGFLLGGITQGEQAAVTLAMPIVILFMSVGVINPSGVDENEIHNNPLVLQWVKALSPIAAAIEASMVGEFAGVKFANSMFRQVRDLPRMGGLALVKNGDETLAALGLSSVNFDAVVSHLITLNLVNFGLCWLGLSVTSNARVVHWMQNVRKGLLSSPSKKERKKGTSQRRNSAGVNPHSQRGRIPVPQWGLPRP